MENRIDELFRSKLLNSSGAEIPGEAEMAAIGKVLKSRRRKKRILAWLWFTVLMVCVSSASLIIYSSLHQSGRTGQAGMTAVGEDRNAQISALEIQRADSSNGGLQQQFEISRSEVSNSAQDNEKPANGQKRAKGDVQSKRAKSINRLPERSASGNHRVSSAALALQDLAGSSRTQDSLTGLELNKTAPTEEEASQFTITSEPMGEVHELAENLTNESVKQSTQESLLPELSSELNPKNEDETPAIADELELSGKVEPALHEESTSNFAESVGITGHKSFISAIEVAVTAGRVSPHFSPSSDDLYLQRRQREEHHRTSFGADVLLTKKFGRLAVQSGLGYSCLGENVQYSATAYGVTQYSDTSYYQYSHNWFYQPGYYMQYVNYLHASVWVYDSLLIHTIDSTYIQEQDSTVLTQFNTSVMAGNGLTCIKALSLPLIFSYTFFGEEARWNIALRTGAEFYYAVNRRAQYLDRSLNGLMDINQYEGYRRTALSGLMSLHVMRNIGRSGYCFVEPQAKFGLSSWNGDFVHTYHTMALRAGVGWKFNQKN